MLYATPELLERTLSPAGRAPSTAGSAEVVYDLFNNRVLASGTPRQFDVELPPASTALYYTGTAAKLNGLTEINR